MFLLKGLTALIGYKCPEEAEEDPRELTKSENSPQKLIHAEGLENIIFCNVSFCYVIR